MPARDEIREAARGDAGFAAFQALAAQGNLVPLYERVLSDSLTPVLAYRCLVRVVWWRHARRRVARPTMWACSP